MRPGLALFLFPQCHLRLATPSLAIHLLSSLLASPIHQTSPSEPPILPQLVSGERERIYWMDIKESIRLNAVKTASEDSVVPPQLIPVATRPQQTSEDYPLGCLLFAKGLDPDASSKTSLKELFSAALRSDETISKGQEVTYIDWSKGLDTVRPWDTLVSAHRCAVAS